MQKTSQTDETAAVQHEYRRQLGDWMLALGKVLVPDPETRHDLLPVWARIAETLKPRYSPPPVLQRTLQFRDRSLPLRMASPIMLAAGGNKHGRHLPAFASLGFGGITVGSATSMPRKGNPHRPRLAMLPQDRAMANSMGLPNPGVDALAASVDKSLGLCHKRRLAVGISVADTPEVEDADGKVADISGAFRKAYGAADYVELNVSCPNTGSGRLDAYAGFLEALLREIMEVRSKLAPRKAVFVKLSPDMGIRTLEQVLRIAADTGVTGLVLFNTFPADKSKFLKLHTAYDKIPALRDDGAKGGISGRPLFRNTLPAVRFIRRELPNMTIFACGGVDHGAKALELLEAGADAVQCYSVLAYRWNAVRKMNRELLQAMSLKGLTSLDKDHPGPA